MVALGVPKKALYSGLSIQESWLQGCLNHLPCSYWSDNLKMPPADLLPMMLASHVAGPFLLALSLSAQGSSDSGWARAFIENEGVFREIYGSDDARKSMKPGWYCELARVLPPPEREGRLEPVMESLPWIGTFDDAPLLIWSPQFSGGAVRGAHRSYYFANISSPEEAFLSRTTMEPLAWHLSSTSDDALDELANGEEQGSRIAATELKLAVKERDEIRAAFGATRG
jgi:hypothetical protein